MGGEGGDWAELRVVVVVASEGGGGGAGGGAGGEEGPDDWGWGGGFHGVVAVFFDGHDRDGEGCQRVDFYGDDCDT